jgi:NAD(P)-dependent dehydrogenase (short-subunit alcohol dehydrogenase family)
MNTQKVALVTGASSGFGHIIASKLAQRSFRVFGTSRKEHATTSENVRMLVLDVRSDQSVQSCVEMVLSQVGRIDVLINNAGQTHTSVIEETSGEQARDVLETNFWGVVRVINTILPVMRQQRNGHIISISSLAGLIGAPGQAFYSASKFALEGYSEALSYEVEQFNIKISLVEPGFFSTNLHHALLRGALIIQDYQALRETIESSIQQAISQGGDPEKVADLVIKVAESKSPRLRYRIGNDAIWTPRLRMLLPETMFRFGTRRRFKLP